MKTSKQKRFAAAFAGMLCISCLTTPFSAAAEDTDITGENDTIAAAEEMPLNTAVSGEISTKGDVDYYKITLPEDGTLQISLTAGWVSDFGDSYCITLYDADGTEISKDDYIYSNTLFPADGRTAGVYYLSLAPHYADYPPTSTYTVTANFTPKSQWEADCAYELEPNDSFNTASPLALSAACQGIFHNYQDTDYYAFTTNQPGKLSVTLRDDMQSSNSLGWSLFFYNRDRKQIGKASLTKGTASVTIPEQGFDPGTFYIQVKTNDMTSRNWSYADQYTITADFTPTDSTYESEPNDTRSDADSCCPMRPSAESWQMHPMWISLPHLSRIVIPELHCNFSTTCRKFCPTAARHPGVFLFTAITLKRRQSTQFPFRPGTFRWEQIPFPQILSWRNPAPTIPKSVAPAQTVIRSWNTH